MFDFKIGIKREDLEMISPYLLLIFADLTIYAHEHNLPVVISSIREDVSGRKHRTHKEGRALDLSSRKWSRFHIDRVCLKLNKKYKEIAAFSASDGKPRACVYHKLKNGQYHFHLQVRPEKLIKKDYF